MALRPHPFPVLMLSSLPPPPPPPFPFCMTRGEEMQVAQLQYRLRVEGESPHLQIVSAATKYDLNFFVFFLLIYAPPPPRNFVFVKKDHKINLFFLSTVGDQEKSCGPSHTVTLSRVSYICLFYIVDFGGIFAPLYDFFRALFHKNNPLRSSSFFMLDPTFKHYHSQILHRGRIIPMWRIRAVLIRIPLFILTF